MVRRSSAYNATVTGGDGAIGQQNVYDGGYAWYTKVGKNGEQNLYAGKRKEGGRATATEVSDNGRQHVLALGESVETTLKEKLFKLSILEGGEYFNNYGSCQIVLHVGAKDVTGEVRVNGNGELYLFAGDRINHTTRKNIPIKDRPDEIIFEVGERNIGKNLRLKLKI
ncbi:hypothetical protein [Bartonella raoultii]|uniref:hypothetical protein n=1 Tax=Bartonella raoultii TaxID=1457020 RepID=UPI00280C0E62|nr:hypothetical protein [Bartonella raoultii]